LIEYWVLNEDTGSSTTELIHGRVATLSAGATWSTDQNGDPALNFNGGPQAQVLSNTYEFLNLTDINTFTIPVAYLPRNIGAGAPMTIFSVDSGNSNMATKIKMNHNGSGSFSAITPPGAGVYVAETGTSVVSANTWQQIAYSRNGLGSGSNKIYVGGVSKTLTVDNPTAAFNDNNSGQKHLIGALADGGPENLDGKISWIAIWGRQLSAAEMTTLAATPYVLLKPAGGSTISGRVVISGNVTMR
jgi:concanavalin A-like lectin/glucanase superfamily protein